MIYTDPTKIGSLPPRTGVIGVTSGCFDLLHPMHVEYLNKCAKCCDHLLVLVDSDMLTMMNKRKLPVINQLDRAYMVDSLKSVSDTAIIDSLDELAQTISAVVSSNTGTGKVLVFKNAAKIYGQPLITVDGTENIIIPDVERFSSTTSIQNFLKQQTVS